MYFYYSFSFLYSQIFCSELMPFNMLSIYCLASVRNYDLENLSFRKKFMFTGYLQVLDKHLSILAKQHIETRFVKIHAEKSPFLTERLKIVVLPTLALIKNAKVDDYVVCT